MVDPKPVVFYYSDLDDPDLTQDMRPPPRLYHYTDAAGFLGIVDSKVCLYATHHRYLNDAGEVSFGLEVASSVLQRLQGRLSAEVKRLVDTTLKKLRSADSFLACLSERHDVLSQWRAYAGNGAGYCIGLRSQAQDCIDGYGDDDDFWSSHLLKCIYDRDKLEKTLEERFVRQIDRFEDLEKSEEWSEALAANLARVARRYAHVAKHEHFQEEREWRFVVDAPPADIRYRVGKLGLTPYRQTDPLTIEQVWVGPGIGPSKVMARRTVEQLLRQRQIEAKVRYWRSPHRG